MTEEITFEHKKTNRGKIYFLIIFIIIIGIIFLAYYYFQKQIVNQLNINSPANNLNAEPAVQWKNVRQKQANYQLQIPSQWFSKEIGNDLLVTSYDDSLSLKPVKKAKVGIQLVNNAANQTMTQWWQSLYQNNPSEDYTQEVKAITIDQQIGEQRILQSPETNPLDLDYKIIVNNQKVIYVFSVITEGYSKKDYQSVITEIIDSFQFPKTAPANLELPLSDAATTATTTGQNLIIYPDWQLYENQDQGFKIEYPKNWRVYSEGTIPNNPDYWQIIFENQKYAGQEMERPYIAVGVLKNQTSLSDWFNLQKEALSEANLLYNENFTINGLEGVMFTSAGLGFNYDFATLFDNKIYHLWSLNSFPADDTLLIYFKMLDSFRLLAIP